MYIYKVYMCVCVLMAILSAYLLYLSNYTSLISNLSDFVCGMVVAARRTGPSISDAADLLSLYLHL